MIGSNETQIPRLFLSYTALDLQAHAQVAKGVAGQMGWTVIDHRDWAPTGRPSVQECYWQVESCDALLVLAGHRLGWVPPKADGGDGRASITSLEVARARSRGIPVVPLVLEGESGVTEESESARAAQQAFRNDLQRTLAGFFGPDPHSVAPLVKDGLEGWDGRVDDATHRRARRMRHWMPALLLVGLVALLLTRVPQSLARWRENPIPHLQGWLTEPAVLIGGSFLLLLAVLWIGLGPKGRPQRMYHLFPLTPVGHGVTYLLAALMVGAWIAAFTTPPVSSEPELDKILSSLLDGQREALEPALDEVRWRKAVYGADAAALREYVLPAMEARSALSRRASIADARARVGKLAAPTQAPSDPRVALLVDLARLHVIAISQDAGRALAHYEETIATKLDELEPIWRAEALYALAAWADLWAFTNELEDLDRTGAPNDDVQTLLARFAKAREALPKNETRPSWVSCAVVNTEAAVHLKLCGREADCQASEKLHEAEQCYKKRDDQVGARGARYNRAVYLMATGGSVEPYNLFRQIFEAYDDPQAGLYAYGIQALQPVTQVGRRIDAREVRRAFAEKQDKKAQSRADRCLVLLDELTSGAETNNTSSCAAAFDCFLTEYPPANLAFCGVDDIPASGATTLPPNAPVIDGISLPSTWTYRGHVNPSKDAKAVVDGCDGTVEPGPTLRLRLPQPAILRARVYSQDDSVLLIRGSRIAHCNDDAPARGLDTGQDAGLRFRAPADDYELFVGTFKKDALDFELRLDLRPDSQTRVAP